MAEKKLDPKKIERVMPNNPEAEAAVLGSMLMDDQAADTATSLVKEDYFYSGQNRLIYKAMYELHDNNLPIDVVSVVDFLESKGKLDEAGSFTYISGLVDATPSAANIDYYIQILRRDALKRNVIHAGNEITVMGYEKEEGKDALESAQSLVFNLASQEITSDLHRINDAVGQANDAIQKMQAGNNVKNAVYTGYKIFDDITHGLKPGEIIILAARPSVGKTAFALNLAANVSINAHKHVAIFSLEMAQDLLAKRMLSYISKVPMDRMNREGGMTNIDQSRYYKAFNTLMAADIYIDDYSMNTPSDVLSKCRRMKREHGLDLVIIDYLQLLSNGDRNESRQVEVSDMSRKMKVYARDLNVPIILLSQMSRDIERRDKHEPLLSDLRESGGIEQDADVVMFLNNPSKYNSALPENEVILDVKKNRNGQTREIKLLWDKETTSFVEAANQDMTEIKEAMLTSKEKKAIANAPKTEAADTVNGMPKEIETAAMPFGSEKDLDVEVRPISKEEMEYDIASDPDYDLEEVDAKDNEDLPF